MQYIKLTLSSIPDSLNVKLRTNRHALNRESKKWDFLISQAADGLIPAEPFKKAQVTMIRHSHRMLDFDGMVGSLKPVMDAIVSTGIVEDDRWGVVGAWTVDQKFRPEKDGPLLEIIVTEI